MKEKHKTAIYVSITALLSILAILFMLLNEATDRPASPWDYIQEDNIKITGKEVVITNTLDRDFDIFGVEATGSMLPFANEYTNVIGFKPMYAREIFDGDIIIFDTGEKFVMHRVTNRIFSGNETYFKTKGDNLLLSDTNLVKLEDIAMKVVMVVY